MRSLRRGGGGVGNGRCDSAIAGRIALDWLLLKLLLLKLLLLDLLLWKRGRLEVRCLRRGRRLPGDRLCDGLAAWNLGRRQTREAKNASNRAEQSEPQQGPTANRGIHLQRLQGAIN